MPTAIPSPASRAGLRAAMDNPGNGCPGNMGDWKGRHRAAWQGSPDMHVRAMRELLTGLADYADAHALRFGDTIGKDYVLGAAWADAMRAVRVLLNGETGTLDCGTLDGWICDALEAETLSVEG